MLNLTNICPVFTATFGPGGFTRVRTNARPRQRQEPQEPRSVLMQLLPLFILFGFSLIQMLPNLFATAPTPDPKFAFSPSTRYNMERQTGGLGIKYHVNSAEFAGHPISAEMARLRQPGPELRRFEGSVDRAYTSELYGQCERGLDRKERLKNQEVGLFGIGTDWDKVAKISSEPIPACEELKRLKLIK